MSELISLHRLLLSILNKVAPVVVEQLQNVGEIALRPYTKDTPGLIEIRVGKPPMLVTITIVDCSIVVKTTETNSIRLDLNDENSLSEDKLAVTVLGVVSRGLAEQVASQKMRSVPGMSNTLYNDFLDVNKSIILKKKYLYKNEYPSYNIFK